MHLQNLVPPSLLFGPLLGGLLAQAPHVRPEHAPLPPTVAIAPTTPPLTAPKAAASHRARQGSRAARATQPLPQPAIAPHAVDGAPADLVQFDRPRADGTLWAIGRDWKACFDGRGFQFVPFFGAAAPRNFPLRIELLAATAGGEPLALRDGAPQQAGNQVRTERGAVTEVVDTAPREVEQSFEFRSLPNRGAVAVEIRLAGEFTARATANGLQFGNAFGAIDYEKALARDAAGRELALAIAWDGTRARIEIPASFVQVAQLPLVLDPVLATNTSLFPGVAAVNEQRHPDVAKTGQLTCAVWRKAWSATDEDAVACLLDDNLVPLWNPFYVDFTNDSWPTPRIAASPYAQNFLVVSQVESAGQAWIGGRLVAQLGVASAQFDIERGGVVGLPGNNFRPDVGSDPYPGTAAFYTVVWEHETAPGNHDIHYKQLHQDGTLRTTNPGVLDSSSTHQSNPSIANSNASDRWFVVWQSTFPSAPFDEDIVAALVEWHGAVGVPAFLAVASLADERRPSVSSPAVVDGLRCALIACEHDNGTDNDVMLRLYDHAGTVLVAQNLSATETFGLFQGRNQILPEVDSDGARFAIGYSEYSGSDYNTFVSTIAHVSPGQLRIDDERVPLGATPGTDDYWTRIWADSSGGASPGPGYSIVGADILANDIELRRYGGYRPGPAFSVFANQCGNLPITATGVPAAGATVGFSLGTTGFAGFVFGFPGAIPIGVCPCLLGVSNGVTVPHPFSWQVPTSPSFVGAFTLSIQGWTLAGTACLSAVDLSDTLDFEIR